MNLSLDREDMTVDQNKKTQQNQLAGQSEEVAFVSKITSAS